MTRAIGTALLVVSIGAASAPVASQRSCHDSPPPVGDAASTPSLASLGAKGDGHADDTIALQGAIDALRPGTTLRLPPGTYRIAAERGLRLKDDMKLDLGEATLVGDNVDGARCRLIEVDGKRNVTISGGTLVGSRGGAPQWGVGIFASDATDLLIENVTFRDFFFDGILLTGNAGCQRVIVRGVLSENNRRTGLAIPSAREVTVERSTFRGSRGQSPEAGVNCEPGPGAQVHGVHFRGCTFSGNAGIGLYVHKALGDAVSDASVEDSVVESNDQGIVMAGVEDVFVVANRVGGHVGKGKSAIALGEGTRRATVTGNRLEGNFRGIVAAGATEVEIRGNTVEGTRPAASAGGGDDGDGIVCRGLKGMLPGACTIADNEVRQAAGSGILAMLVSGLRIEGNTVDSSGQRGLFLRSAVNNDVRNNKVLGASGEVRGRYDGIELAQSANDNRVIGNEVKSAAAMRSAIRVGADCRGNEVSGNKEEP